MRLAVSVGCRSRRGTAHEEEGTSRSMQYSTVVVSNAQGRHHGTVGMAPFPNEIRLTLVDYNVFFFSFSCVYVCVHAYLCVCVCVCVSFFFHVSVHRLFLMYCSALDGLFLCFMLSYDSYLAIIHPRMT